MILLPLALGFGRFLVRPGNISKRRRTRANDAVGGRKRRVEVEPSESASHTAPRLTPLTVLALSLSPRRKHPLRREPPRTDDTEAVRALRDSLWAANQSIADWQAKTAELQTQLDQLREDQKRPVCHRDQPQ